MPVDGGRTFLHLSYSYTFGTAGRLAMQVYLGTVGSSKVGFTVTGTQPDGQRQHIGGMRGVVERNTMRYFLAIEAFLGALAVPPLAAAAGTPAQVIGVGDADADVELAVVKSPIVGTFYRSPEPSASPFVEIGSVVKKGDVLCIIEAMKLMNEIDSEYDGEIVSVYVESGQPVQYGERLYAIRTR